MRRRPLTPPADMLCLRNDERELRTEPVRDDKSPHDDDDDDEDDDDREDSEEVDDGNDVE